MAIKMILSDNSPKNKKRMVNASGGKAVENSSGNSQRKFAGASNVSVPITKSAQFAGSGANVVWSQPMFFSPLHTPMNWQIASRRREVYQWCRFYYCFTPDNMVLMADGTEKRIDEVKIGDEIINGEGGISLVKKVYTRLISEPILNLKIGGINRKIRTTFEHEIPRVSESNWLKSDLTTPSLRRKGERIRENGQVELKEEWDSVKTIEIGDRLFLPRTLIGNGFDKEKYNDEIFYLLGLFLAEGSYYWYKYKRKKEPKALRFSIHAKEVETIGRKIENIVSKLGLSVCHYHQNNEECVDLVCFNTKLAKYFYKIVGEGCKRKKIHKDFLNNANEVQLLLFLAGYIDGDGCIDPHHGCQIITASDILASQIPFILEKLGFTFSIYKTKPEIRRIPNNKLSSKKIYNYNIRISRHSLVTSNLLKYSVNKNICLETHHTKYREYLYLGDKLYRAVCGIEREFYEGEVFDLELKDVHSYCVNRCVVHNSNEPKVAAGVDFYSNFSMNNFKLECKSKKVLKYYEKLADKLELSEKLNYISHEYFLLGDVFPFLEISCPKCGGRGITSEGERCRHEDGTFKSVKVMNPDYMEVKSNPLASEPEYYLVPDEELKMLITRREPRKLYDNLPDELIALVSSGQPIPLSSRSVSHIKHNASPYGTFGNSMLQRLFTMLAYKTKIMTANWIVAERLIVPVRVVKVGEKERPATEADLQDIVNQLSAVANDPNLTIVTHHAIDFDWVGACHAADTEILTIHGWRRFYEIDENEIVGTYNTQFKEVQFQQVQEYHEYDFKSTDRLKMYHFKAHSVDINVTPNHRMLVERNGVMKEIYSQEVKHNDKFISTVNWRGIIPSVLPYSHSSLSHLTLDEYLELIGYYITEGGAKEHKHISLENKLIRGSTFSQREESPIYNSMKKLINKVCPRYSEHKDKRYTQVCSSMTINSSEIGEYFAKEFGSHCWNKKIPRWIKNLPKDKLKILYDAMMAGDGNIRYDGLQPRYKYTTTSRTLSDDFSEICLKLGYFTILNIEKSEKQNIRTSYILFWSEGRRHVKYNIRKQHIKRADYEGKVYCVKVPNTWIVTRRNGRITVQGNTGKIHNITQELEYVGKEMLDGLMLNQAILNGEAAGYNCMDEDTLTLTNSGFKRYNEINEIDKIACYNPTTREVEYHPYSQKYVYDYEGDLIHFQTTRIDVRVTPNHKMYTQKRDHNKYEFTEAKDIKRRSRFIGRVEGFSGNYTKKVKIGDTELSIYDYCELVGFYVSEGCTAAEKRKNRINQLTTSIHQSKNGKAYKQIENLFNRSFHTHHVTHNGFQVYNPELSKHLKENYGGHACYKKLTPFIKNLVPECLEIVIEAMAKGDGHISGEEKEKKYITYWTSSHQLAEDFAEISFKCGYSVMIKEIKKKNKKIYFNKTGHRFITRHPVYVVYVSKGRKGKNPVLDSRSVRYDHKEIVREQYKGKVYCFEVPYHLFVTMRNGKITVQGNSAQVGVEVLIRRLENWRNKLKDWVEKHIFLPVAMMQGFINEEESELSGEIIYLYPKLIWNDLQLRDKTNKIQSLMQLHDKGLVSAQSILEELGLDYDTEVEKIREEQVMASAAGMITPGAGGGMLGTMGMGSMPGGAGLPMEPGLMPGGGGGMGGAGEMGGIGGAGGAAPAGGMGGAPMAAQTLPAITKRGKGKKEEEQVPPMQMIKLTKLEQKMYKLLQEMKVPFPLFGQYSVKLPGEQRPFLIDFAYPKIGVGIESDGSIWHEREDFAQRDRIRDQKLASVGWRILRFKEDAIEDHLDAVSDIIYKNIVEAGKKLKKKAEGNNEIIKYATASEFLENNKAENIGINVVTMPQNIGYVYLIGTINNV